MLTVLGEFVTIHMKPLSFTILLPSKPRFQLVEKNAIEKPELGFCVKNTSAFGRCADTSAPNDASARAYEFRGR